MIATLERGTRRVARCCAAFFSRGRPHRPVPLAGPLVQAHAVHLVPAGAVLVGRLSRLRLVLQHGACDEADSRLDADPAARQRPARHHRVPLVEVTRPVQLSIKQLGALGAHGPALQVRYGKRLARAGQVWSRHVSRVDGSCTEFAAFGRSLRTAAATEGFESCHRICRTLLNRHEGSRRTRELYGRYLLGQRQFTDRIRLSEPRSRDTRRQPRR